MLKKTTKTRTTFLHETPTNECQKTNTEIYVSGNIVQRISGPIELQGRTPSEIHTLTLVEYFSKFGEACTTLYKGKIVQAQANTPWGENFLFSTHGIFVVDNIPVSPFAVEVVKRTKNNRPIKICLAGTDVEKLIWHFEKTGDCHTLQKDLEASLSNADCGTTENFFIDLSREEYFYLAESEKTIGLKNFPHTISLVRY